MIFFTYRAISPFYKCKIQIEICCIIIWNDEEAFINLYLTFLFQRGVKN